MACTWLKASPSFTRGVSIINELEESKFEQFLRRIITKLKLKDSEIFTGEERQKLEKIFKVDEESLILSIKTLLYLFKRLLKFIFMPDNLKNDLSTIGLSNEKADIILKIWSVETRATVHDMDTESVFKSKDELNFTYKLNAELSSDYAKKCKIPKAYIKFQRENSTTELELTHGELHSTLISLETIQNELDNLI